MDAIKRAVEFYGKNNQMVKAMEEMAELQQALSKYLLCDDPEQAHILQQNVEEETADVLIMCEQLKIMFDQDSIEWYRDYKIKRLAERLNNAR